MELSNYILNIVLDDEKVLMFNTANGKSITISACEYKNILSENKENIKSSTIRVLEQCGFLLNWASEGEKHNKTLAINMNVTNECNFDCAYCYFKASNTESSKEYIRPKEFTHWLFLLLERNEYLDSIYINFLGGEPLLRLNEICEIINRVNAFCKKSNIKIKCTVTTNGYLLDREAAAKLVELGIRTVQITLDGYGEDHDLIRNNTNGTGTYKKILENIKNTKEMLDITVRINFSSKTQMGNLDLLLNDLKRAEIRHLYFSPIEEVVGNKDGSEVWIESRKETLERYTQVWRLQKRKGFKIEELLPAIVGTCIAKNPMGLTINYDGNIYPCPSMCGIDDFKYGNMKESEIYIPRKVDKHEECRRCELYPICLGGCEYQSYVSHKYQGDKNCDKKYKKKLMAVFLKEKYS